MKRLLIAALASAFCLSWAFASPSQFKHTARNVSCAQCHKTDNPVKAAKASTCKQCHNYDALAKKTASLPLNPHDSHAGQLRCTLCHKEHSQSVSHCKTCHKNGDPKFDFKTP